MCIPVKQVDVVRRYLQHVVGVQHIYVGYILTPILLVMTIVIKRKVSTDKGRSYHIDKKQRSKTVCDNWRRACKNK